MKKVFCHLFLIPFILMLSSANVLGQKKSETIKVKDLEGRLKTIKFEYTFFVKIGDETDEESWGFSQKREFDFASHHNARLYLRILNIDAPPRLNLFVDPNYIDHLGNMRYANGTPGIELSEGKNNDIFFDIITTENNHQEGVITVSIFVTEAGQLLNGRKAAVDINSRKITIISPKLFSNTNTDINRTNTPLNTVTVPPETASTIDRNLIEELRDKYNDFKNLPEKDLDEVDVKIDLITSYLDETSKLSNDAMRTVLNEEIEGANRMKASLESKKANLEKAINIEQLTREARSQLRKAEEAGTVAAYEKVMISRYRSTTAYNQAKKAIEDLLELNLNFDLEENGKSFDIVVTRKEPFKSTDQVKLVIKKGAGEGVTEGFNQSEWKISDKNKQIKTISNLPNAVYNFSIEVGDYTATKSFDTAKLPLKAELDESGALNITNGKPSFAFQYRLKGADFLSEPIALGDARTIEKSEIGKKIAELLGNQPNGEFQIIVQDEDGQSRQVDELLSFSAGILWWQIVLIVLTGLVLLLLLFRKPLIQMLSANSTLKAAFISMGWMKGKYEDKKERPGANGEAAVPGTAVGPAPVTTNSKIKIRERVEQPAINIQNRKGKPPKPAPKGYMLYKDFSDLINLPVYYKVNMSYYWDDSTVSNIFIHAQFVKIVHEFIALWKNRFEEMELTENPEVGGFLLGKFTQIPSSGKYEITLDSFVPIESQNHTVYQIEFGSDAWRMLDEASTKQENLALVGWFHTHPGHGLFLSQPDLRIANFEELSRPYQVAMELDSETEDLLTGFFSRKMSDNNMNIRRDEDDWLKWTKLEEWTKAVNT